MIACASKISSDDLSGPHEVTFESIFPAIKRQVAFAFRRVRRSLREDLVAEAVARAYMAFARLIERGLTALVYPAALVRFAVRQVWDGRRIGCRRSAKDVMSESAQARRGFVVEQLEHRSPRQPWEEQLLVDKRATPAELVACKLDFAAWLERLSKVKRALALRLAAGDTAREAAMQFRLSEGRISQLRRELLADWNAFQALPGPV
jgi:hypothetical protein